MTESEAAGPRQNEQNEWRCALTSGSFTVGATTDDIVRVAYLPADGRPHRTWSLAPSAADLSATHAAFVTVDAGTTLSMAGLRATATTSAGRETLHIRVARHDGSMVLADATISISTSGQPVWTSQLAKDERVYGGGERTGSLDRRGRAMTFWTTDPLPNHGDQTDAMYQSVPLLIGLVDGLSYGIYFDVNERAVADIGKSQPGKLIYAPESSDLVAYILAGPALGDVLRQYSSLTGRMSALPRWAFGYQQSRWGYLSADDVLEIAGQFRSRAIPCDAIYLDIDYMDGYRVFTWDAETFPDPARLTRTLRDQHIRLVTIIDPGVKVDPDYQVYRDGDENGYFVRATDGSSFKGWVWPGESSWPDFAREDVRAWWGARHRGLVEAGVAGIWNDMNEPAQAGISTPPDVTIPHGATLPDDVLHGAHDDPITHAQFHNAYGLEMCQATDDALRALRPDERPFVLTRAATAGSQRYAIVWNGDSTSSWENLRLAVPINLGMGLSGFPMTGGDIGGFWQDTTAELLVRWTQLGALLPFCRNHSAAGTARQEPWAFGEPYTSLCRAAIERRYQLLPYLLTLAREASMTGAPIVRPLAWISPTEAASRACDDQFLLGDSLLVAPVVEEGATTREVLLPPGEWFAWDSSTLHPGEQRLSVPVQLSTVPLFVRAGTILPLAAVAQSTDSMTDRPLTLHLYLTPDHATAICDVWLDDDHPQAEDRGAFGEWQARAAWRDEQLSVTCERVNGSLPWPFPGCSVAPRLPYGWTAQPYDTADIIPGDGFTARFRVTRG